MPLPPRRRRSLAAGGFWLAVLVILLAGGYWAYQHQEETARLREALQSQYDRLWGGDADSTIPVPSAEVLEEEAPPASPTTQPDLEPPAPEQARGDQEATEQAALPPAPAPEAERLLQDGPPVIAAPAAPVDVAPLGEAEPELAPLPADATPRQRELAARALSGDALAQHDLATLYAQGALGGQDLPRAVYWYRRSAETGVPEALYNLGVLTTLGHLPGEDGADAHAYYLRAAEADHAQAQLQVGLALTEGTVVGQDLQQAVRWFQAANANGEPVGAFHLGRLFEQGVDGAPDPDAASAWYRIAAQAGYQPAIEAMERLGRPVSDRPLGVGGGGEEVAVTLEPPPLPEPESPPPSTTPRPILSDDIVDIQNLLRDLGFDPGPIDGLMGQQTREAIRQFQASQGLSVTGEPSLGLIDQMRDAL